MFEFLLFGLLGLCFLVLGVLFQSGRLKTWFLQKSYPVIAPKAIAFAFIPIGISFIFASLTALLPDMETRGKAFVYGAMPIFFIGLILAMWQPKWILPKWYRWLLEEHGDILVLLEEEARGMKRWEWQQRVSTQADLESWVAEVRRKHRL